MRAPSPLRSAAAEALGTFALVFIGTGAIVVDDLGGGALGPLAVCIAFGGVVTTMIYAVGDVSGAHLNPAVSLAFWLARRLPGGQLIRYAAAQAVGALAASALLRLLFREHAGLGATLPSGPWAQAFALEVVLTFFLVFVILGVATGAKEKGVMAGVAVGAVVALGAIVGGPVSGGSMNPARSLGPAVLTGQLAPLWLYFLAPAAGASLAVGACRCVREPGCCARGGERAPA